MANRRSSSSTLSQARGEEDLGRRPTIWTRALHLAVVLLLIAVLGLGYFLIVPKHQIVKSKLSTFVPVKPLSSAYSAKPSKKTTVAASGLPFSAAASAAKSSPNQTAAYSIEWKGKAKNAVADLLLVVTPSQADAKKVLSEAVSKYISTKGLATNSFKATSHFKVASLGDASGVTFTATGVKSVSASVAARQGRVVFIPVVQGSAKVVRTEAIALAKSENAVVETALRNHSFEKTTYPVTSSALYGTLGGLIIVAAFLEPTALRRFRRRQAEVRQAERTRERMVRGSKVVRRQTSSFGTRPPTGHGRYLPKLSKSYAARLARRR